MPFDISTLKLDPASLDEEMPRFGQHSDAIGGNARYANFTLSDWPSIVYPGCDAARESFPAIRKADALFTVEKAKIQANVDLTQEAKDRKEIDALGVRDATLAEVLAAMKAGNAETAEAVQASVERVMEPPGFEEPTLRWERLSGSDEELARLQVAQLRQARMVQDAHDRDRVDRLLDDGLKGDPANVLRVYETVLATGDPNLERTWTTWGARRIEADGTDTHRDLFARARARVGEHRVLGNDALLLALDWRDVVATATMLVETCSKDPTLVKAAALRVLGPDLVEIGE